VARLGPSFVEGGPLALPPPCPEVTLTESHKLSSSKVFQVAENRGNIATIMAV